MKSYSFQTTADSFENELKSKITGDIDLAILFSSNDIINEDLLKKIKNQFPNAEIIGCSTSGEIGDSVEDDSISVLAMKFESTKIKCATVEISDMAASRKAGSELAGKLAADDLKGVFVLSPGLNVNGSKFTVGLKDVFKDDISISGGLAGDGLNFSKTTTIYNDKVYSNHAVGVGFYGDNVEIRSDARGGWKPFGPLRRVTKAEDNILYELDGKPALALYKEYLGDKASDLPSSGLLYPFAIMDDEDAEDSVGLIRTILDINEETGSLVLAGDMEVGQRVCLMNASTEQLVEGAEKAAENLGDVSDSDGILLCVSCVGRKILMGDDTEEELDSIRDIVGEHFPIAGFYSYGEICHYERTKQAELHNQTMTITFITEKAA